MEVEVAAVMGVVARRKNDEETQRPQTPARLEAKEEPKGYRGGLPGVTFVAFGDSWSGLLSSRCRFEATDFLDGEAAAASQRLLLAIDDRTDGALQKEIGVARLRRRVELAGCVCAHDLDFCISKRVKVFARDQRRWT